MATPDPVDGGGLTRGHAFFVAATVPLFLGALLTDWAYWSSHQIEWSTFASWLLAGGLVFCAGAVLFAAASLRRGGPARFNFALLLITWILGLLDALIHARDAWAVMPTGLVLSLIVAVLAVIAAWRAFSAIGRGVWP